MTILAKIEMANSIQMIPLPDLKVWEEIQEADGVCLLANSALA